MKILIAIPSCLAHLSYQEAQRKTWIKDVPKSVDVRFVLGLNFRDLYNPGDEVYLGEDAFKPEQGLKKYPTLPQKTRQICAFASNCRNKSRQEISLGLPLWSHQFQMRQSSFDNLLRSQEGFLAIKSLMNAISTSVMLGLKNVRVFIRI